jgi:hypothetical protein
MKPGRKTIQHHAPGKAEQSGLSTFGLMTNQAWDIRKRLAFTFPVTIVAKMMSGKQRVLEIGCADAFATALSSKRVKELTAIDFDPIFIEDVKMRIIRNGRCHVLYTTCSRDPRQENIRVFMPWTSSSIFDLKTNRHS